MIRALVQLTLTLVLTFGLDPQGYAYGNTKSANADREKFWHNGCTAGTAPSASGGAGCQSHHEFNVDEDTLHSLTGCDASVGKQGTSSLRQIYNTDAPGWVRSLPGYSF